MPIYEYVCSKCGHEWDAIQKFSEKPLTTCPKCAKKAAKRKISASAFHLKGSGWYVTDYKGGGAKSDSGEKPAETSETKSESKTESKAESKPEAKAEAKPASKTESKTAKKKKSKSAAA